MWLRRGQKKGSLPKMTPHMWLRRHGKKSCELIAEIVIIATVRAFFSWCNKNVDCFLIVWHISCPPKKCRRAVTSSVPPWILHTMQNAAWETTPLPHVVTSLQPLFHHFFWRPSLLNAPLGLKLVAFHPRGLRFRPRSCSSNRRPTALLHDAHGPPPLRSRDRVHASPRRIIASTV